MAFNYVFNNKEAVGLWVDVRANNVSIHHNVIRDNHRGISYEISRGGKIYQNLIENHPSSFGIIIGNSNNTQVTNNTVNNAATGILINQNFRDYLPVNNDPNDCVDSDTSGDEAIGCNSQIRNIDVLRNKITVTGDYDKLVGIRVAISPNTEYYPSTSDYYDYLAERFYKNSNYNLKFNNNHYIFPKRPDSNTWRESKRFYAGWDNTFPNGRGTKVISFDEWSQNTQYPSGPKRDAYRCIEENFPNTASRTVGPIQKSILLDEPAVSAYPIPFSDQLTFSVKNLALNDIRQISLVSLEGTVYRINSSHLRLTNAGTSLAISLPQLAAGVYLLKIDSRNEVETIPVIKQAD